MGIDIAPIPGIFKMPFGGVVLYAVMHQIALQGVVNMHEICIQIAVVGYVVGICHFCMGRPHRVHMLEIFFS